MNGQHDAQARVAAARMDLLRRAFAGALHIVVTPGVLDLAAGETVDLALLLGRHYSGDWGDLDTHDRALNDHSLLTGDRLFSCYTVDARTTIYIITEAEDDVGTRQATTVLLSDEY